MEIKQLTAATEDAARDLSRLASELHTDERTMSLEQLQTIVDDKNIVLMVAIDEGKIIGMGANYTIRKIASTKCYMEDLIVDDSYRGKGIGGQLIQKLIDSARAEGARSLEFMTATHRTDAHRFYEKLGFTNKDRFVYKMTL